HKISDSLHRRLCNNPEQKNAMVTLFALWQHCRIYYCRLKLTAVFVKRLKKGNFFVKRFLLKVNV
ncbi:hypothetical protein Pgy4_36660, partial [Pseudomonas savastanoi pv. glycinea str. race 4]